PGERTPGSLLLGGGATLHTEAPGSSAGKTLEPAPCPPLLTCSLRVYAREGNKLLSSLGRPWGFMLQSSGTLAHAHRCPPAFHHSQTTRLSSFLRSCCFSNNLFHTAAPVSPRPPQLLPGTCCLPLCPPAEPPLTPFSEPQALPRAPSHPPPSSREPARSLSPALPQRGARD
ncbi:unnamed protein product, partial [Gulo gulo]